MHFLREPGTRLPHVLAGDPGEPLTGVPCHITHVIPLLLQDGVRLGNVGTRAVMYRVTVLC